MELHKKYFKDVLLTHAQFTVGHYCTALQLPGMTSAPEQTIKQTIWDTNHFPSNDVSLRTDSDSDHAHLYLGPVEHQPAESSQFGDVCEGLWLEAVAGGQVELLQPRTGLRDDFHAGLVQEVAAGQLQADQAEAAGLHEAEGKNG